MVSESESKDSTGLERRAFLGYFAATGLGATLLPGVLWNEVAVAQSSKVTAEMVRNAATISGLEFTDDECEQIARGVSANQKNYSAIRALPIKNDVPPAFQFHPLPAGETLPKGESQVRFSKSTRVDRPSNLESLAHWSVIDLAQLIRTRKVTSVELTKMYIDRIKRYNDELNCVITLTEARALRQAEEADREIAAGRYKGVLHGIPWGAKDLLAVKGYPTTWGATPFKDQVIDIDATVVQRLDEAGAVLIAKLSLGALAQNDIWMGKRTKNPWNTKYGSSGSSAGPASATAAGLVAFSIGSETNGSITSPATTCGVTGLRPTFGRISRHGAMALSWTMDKLGPMCRTVEDCATVFAAIHGSDGFDTTTVGTPFHWDPEQDSKSIRVGYLKSAFDGKPDHNTDSLERMRSLGFDLVPVAFPDFDYSSLNFILMVEAAAAFDAFTRGTDDDALIKSGWPNAFRQARMVPAVEYIQANRARTLLMRDVNTMMKDIDVLFTPTFQHLVAGNLTGHPIVCVPDGFNDRGLPSSIGFFGGLYKESEVLRVAKKFQDASDVHLKHPKQFSV